jgi:ATP-dependent DNA helicase
MEIYAERAEQVDAVRVDVCRQKALDLHAQGKQLDLLLLKALQYSNFISDNQKLSAEVVEKEDSAPNGSCVSASSKKRKRTSKSSPRKLSKVSHTREGLSDATRKMESARAESSQFSQPSNLVGGTLKDYQLEGLRWLANLWENGISGILADEMGLGKTIQVIALLAHLREKGVGGPFLVAAPLATLPNWVKEFRKWLPSASVLLYHGSKDERAHLRSTSMPLEHQDTQNFPVIVTSYEICIADRPYLNRFNWKFIVVDEGHRIKNRKCKLVRELKQLHSASRLLLTGTPIQNTLEELWSLLNFVNPMIFDDLEVFQSWFGFRNIGRETQVDEILGQEQQDRIVSKLHEILRPFLLRRLKLDVLTDIPPKKELVVYCHMSPLQREYYSQLHDQQLKETLTRMGIEGAKRVSEINLQMNLRKVCNHPFLFGEPKDPDTQEYIGDSNPRVLTSASGKMKVLYRMLVRLLETGHKILIFSQMTELLNILEDFIQRHMSLPCYRIDGSVKMAERQQMIEDFNAHSNVSIFLLSTRAGGLGINLAAADTCIIYDSDWNPHGDAQAQDRCHRIGQTRPVVVYRLLTTGSVEIEMLEKQISKRKLERMAIVGGEFGKAGRKRSKSFTVDRLKQLLEVRCNTYQRCP